VEIRVGETFYDKKEIDAVVKVMEEGWLGVGKYTDLFEKRLASYVGHKYGIATNSGSSALLLAVQALNLPKESKVIVCAAGFPATVAPILHAGLTPVFVDAEMISYSIDPEQMIEASFQEKDIKAVVFAHTVGNVANMDMIMALAKNHNWIVIEDICDALSAKWNGKQVGSFGDIACLSFYPSHHITAGGLGGMVLTSNDQTAKDVISLRDWGKMHETPDYYNAYTTDQRYFIKVDDIDYDYRYVYSHVGYNLKPSDLNSAFGLVQMNRLNDFIEKRNDNFDKIAKKFYQHPEFFEIPSQYEQAEPSWFNYPVVLKENLPFTRDELVKYFESKGIRCRLFFAGNITRHPAFKGKGIIIGELPVSDYLMRNAFLIACHPKLNDKHITYIGDCLRDYIHTEVRKYTP
jgi:CDP-4-dehydro-6-deoxyglucose reductase, E1